MSGRLQISFCFFLAFALLQAHNFIPHHHDDVIENDRHHHHDEGEEDHQLPDTDLIHDPEFGKIIAKPQDVNEIVARPLFVESIFITAYDLLAAFESPPKYHPPDVDSVLHLNYRFHNLPSRAPPVIGLIC